MLVGVPCLILHSSDIILHTLGFSPHRIVILLQETLDVLEVAHLSQLQTILPFVACFFWAMDCASL